MKVTLPKNYKEYYTIYQVEQMKAVIAAEKDDEETIKGWAEYAVNEALKDDPHYIVEVYKATAETCLNNKVWNAYGEDTGIVDVWIEAVAETSEGFVKVGAYLSDIWQSGAVDYRNRLYVEKYSRA
ncbi:MAG: hypothetical protein IKX20_11210 [Paludibacteraceae bacterium]|nr:hypothetical protein [Paludibacteraceae bacterium]